MSKTTTADSPEIVNIVMDEPRANQALELDSSIVVRADRADESKLFYGWYMLLMAMGAAIASSPGQTFAISIFNEPLRLELGLSHGRLALAYMLGTLLGALPIYWIGYQMDRRGLRRTMLAVICLFSLTCLAMSTVQNWVQLMLAFTFLRMLGPGALALLSSNVLPFWFSKKLGTVEGLRQTAMAAAMTIVPPLNVFLVASFGWRSAYGILGASIFLLLVPLYWRYFRQSPEEVGQALDGRSHRITAVPGPGAHAVAGQPSAGIPSDSPGVELSFQETLRTRSFWLVLGGTSLFCMIHTGVFFCLVPIFAEHGWNEQFAASMLVIFAVSLACSQIAGGWLSDRFAARYQLMMGMMLFAGGLYLLWLGLSLTLVLVAGGMLGAAQGIYFASSQPLWARYYGRLNLGKLRGILMATNVATSSLGPLLVGMGRDVMGGFGPVLLLFALLPLPFAVSSWWVTPPVGPTASPRSGSDVAW